MGKTKKTNAMRMLDRAKVAYQTNVFEVTEEHQTGEQIAALVHANVEDVYKTLVLENANHDHFVFVIPVNATLDMKKLHMKQERKN
ncbi:ebsC protein [Staphylococcus warneri]|nr:ebsC protein [Staphylococcus warneri]